jgi:hypothetical protein
MLEAQVKSQCGLFRIYGEQSGTGLGFSPSTSVLSKKIKTNKIQCIYCETRGVLSSLKYILLVLISCDLIRNTW